MSNDLIPSTMDIMQCLAYNSAVEKQINMITIRYISLEDTLGGRTSV